nr:zinc finger, CCHC-type [Tanacetum cinerariifolium]
MPELLEDATVKGIRTRAKWENDDYICGGHILNDDLSLVQLGSHLRIEESLRAQDSDKGKGKEVSGPSVNVTEGGGKNKHHKQNKGIAVVVKKTTQMLVVLEKGLRSNPKTKIDSGATTHVCKDRCWFKTFELVEDGFVLYMGDEYFELVHGKGSVALEFSSRETVTLFNVLCVPKLRKNLVFGHVLNKCGYKQVYESDKYILSKCGVFVGFGYYNNDDASRFCYVYLLHAKDEALDKFRIYKTEVKLQQNDLIKTLRTDRGGEYYDLVFFQSVGVIYETTAPYTPQQNGMAEKKNKALKKMVNFMSSSRV